MVKYPNKLLDHARAELDTFGRVGKQTSSEMILALFNAERLIAELRDHCNAMEVEHRQAIEEMQSALAREARLSEALTEIVETARGHIPPIPPDGPTSVEHQVAYEATGFMFLDVERIARAALSGSGAGGWRDISSAPKDGTRILIKAVTFGWSSDVCQNVATGEKAVEARWAKGLCGEYKWLEWCGNERTHSTDGALVPLGWLPLPAAPTGEAK